MQGLPRRTYSPFWTIFSIVYWAAGLAGAMVMLAVASGDCLEPYCHPRDHHPALVIAASALSIAVIYALLWCLRLWLARPRGR